MSRYEDYLEIKKKNTVKLEKNNKNSVKKKQPS